MKDVIDSITTSDGLFHDGDQSTGALGTIVTAKFQNDVQAATQNLQREVINVLKKANPAIVLDPLKTDQLVTALQAIFLQSGNNLSEIKTAGVAAIAATLGNLGLTDISTAGVATGTAATPGLIKLPIMIAGVKKIIALQWGTAAIPAASNVTVSYPQAFTLGLVQFVTPLDSSPTNVYRVAVSTSSLSTLTFVSSNTNNTTGVMWLAIGVI